MNFNKLVRDKIPGIIKDKGKSCKFTILSDDDYKLYLLKKLTEEVEEFLEDDNLEELADITEVIHALVRSKGYTIEELEAVRKEKKETKGGFEDKILLLRVENK